MPVAELIAALVCLQQRGGKVSTPADDHSINMTEYIASIHWDPKKNGPLIAVDADRLYINDDAPKDLSGFGQKMVKAGNLSVIAQNWMITLEDSDLPNAYDALSVGDKINFLLASLPNSDIFKLTSTGLSPRELSGQAKLALLSLIPKPLVYREGTVSGGGTSTSGDTITLPPDAQEAARIQICKGIEVSFGMKSSQPGTYMARTLSSLDTRGPEGTPIFVSNNVFNHPGATSEFPGRLVPSSEKKSQISWSDPRLKVMISLKRNDTLGQVVETIRSQTGIDVFADKRISTLTVNAYGESCLAGDLLRGIALSILGVVRKVGNAYVITANLEGDGAQQTKLQGHKSLGNMSIQGEVGQWRVEAEKRGVLKTMPVSQDDPFQGSLISVNDIASGESDFQKGWVPLSRLPGAISVAISDAITRDSALRPGRPNQPRDSYQPVPEYADKARVTTVTGYRIVLPDGRPLEFNRLNVDGNRNSTTFNTAGKHPGLPRNTSTLPTGSAVEIKTDDPDLIDKECALLVESGIKEIWLDSLSSGAIQHAIRSGLVVDLVVHPWDAFKGEVIEDPDRNIVGLTGDQVDQLPGARVDTFKKSTFHYAKSLSPADPKFSSHLDQLIRKIPATGIHKLIVLNTEPSGYEKALPNGQISFWEGQQVVNGVTLQPGIHELVPSYFEFGYTQNLREQYLRKFQIDPVDIISTFKFGPPNPYFDQGPFGMPSRSGPYGSVHFPRVRQTIGNQNSHDWQVFLHKFAQDGETKLKQALNALNLPVLYEAPGVRDATISVSPYTAISSAPWTPDTSSTDGNCVLLLRMHPEVVENEQGVPVWDPYIPEGVSLSFDLSDVPSTRFASYLRYLFKTGPVQ